MGVWEWWKWKQGPVKKFCSNTHMARVKVMPWKWEERVKFRRAKAHATGFTNWWNARREKTLLRFLLRILSCPHLGGESWKRRKTRRKDRIQFLTGWLWHSYSLSGWNGLLGIKICESEVQGRDLGWKIYIGQVSADKWLFESTELNEIT